MKTNKIIFFSLILALLFFFFPLDALLYSQKGRSSFGGSRSVTPRSFSSPRMRQPRSSFGGTRSMAPLPRTSSPFRTQQNALPRSSFGGKASSGILSQSNIMRKYGVPRKVITSREIPNLPSNVVVNHYGNFASGLMMGYLMGHTSWLWYLPFHPAFYYGPPQRVVNPDGTISYYPPTFDFGKLFMTLIFFGSIGFIAYQFFKSRRKRNSFTGFNSRNLSKSSFS